MMKKQLMLSCVLVACGPVETESETDGIEPVAEVAYYTPPGEQPPEPFVVEDAESRFGFPITPVDEPAGVLHVAIRDQQLGIDLTDECAPFVVVRPNDPIAFSRLFGLGYGIPINNEPGSLFGDPPTGPEVTSEESDLVRLNAARLEEWCR